MAKYPVNKVRAMGDTFSNFHKVEEATLGSHNTAVIVVDMINDFCKPGGKMVLPGSESLLAPQLDVIAAARKVGAPVIWVHDSHRNGLRRDREWLKRTVHCEANTWGVQIIDELGARDDEFHINKPRYSAFFQTDLNLILQDMEVKQVIVFGVVTNICVRSTVHDAFFNGYHVVVPADCCAATGPREQESSLYDIATHFGIVSTGANVCASLLVGAVLRQD